MDYSNIGTMLGLDYLKQLLGQDKASQQGGSEGMQLVQEEEMKKKGEEEEEEEDHSKVVSSDSEQEQEKSDSDEEEEDEEEEEYDSEGEVVYKDNEISKKVKRNIRKLHVTKKQKGAKQEPSDRALFDKDITEESDVRTVTNHLFRLIYPKKLNLRIQFFPPLLCPKVIPNCYPRSASQMPLRCKWKFVVHPDSKEVVSIDWVDLLAGQPAAPPSRASCISLEIKEMRSNMCNSVEIHFQGSASKWHSWMPTSVNDKTPEDREYPVSYGSYTSKLMFSYHPPSHNTPATFSAPWMYYIGHLKPEAIERYVTREDPGKRRSANQKDVVAPALLVNHDETEFTEVFARKREEEIEECKEEEEYVLIERNVRTIVFIAQTVEWLPKVFFTFENDQEKKTFKRLMKDGRFLLEGSKFQYRMRVDYWRILFRIGSSFMRVYDFGKLKVCMRPSGNYTWGDVVQYKGKQNGRVGEVVIAMPENGETLDSVMISNERHMTIRLSCLLQIGMKKVHD